MKIARTLLASALRRAANIIEPEPSWGPGPLILFGILANSAAHYITASTSGTAAGIAQGLRRDIGQIPIGGFLSRICEVEQNLAGRDAVRLRNQATEFSEALTKVLEAAARSS